jgi:hypothetical protein
MSSLYLKGGEINISTLSKGEHRYISPFLKRGKKGDYFHRSKVSDSHDQLDKK